jgi:PAS domain S-box-containing protein
MTHTSFLRTLMVSVLVCANLLVCGVSAVSLLQSRRQYEVLAQTTTQNIATALDQNLANSVQKIDLSLRNVVDDLEFQLAHKVLDETLTAGLLTRLERRLPEVEGFRVSNAQGLIILGKHVRKEDLASIADREFFIHLRDHPDAELQITKPLVGRVSKRNVIIFARRYNYPDGSFAGIVNSTIIVEHFAKLLENFNLGARGTIVLRDLDLGLIARYPYIGEQPSGKLGNSIVSPEFRQQIASGVQSATYYTPASPDGVERTISFRRMRNVPMIVVAGVGSDDYLANWYKERMQTAVIAAGFLLLSLLLGGVLQRMLGQAERRGLQLRQSEQRFRTLFERSPFGQMLIDPENLRILECNPEAASELGYSCEELCRLRVPDVAPELHETQIEVLRHQLQTEGSQVQFETRARHKDGTVREFSVSLVLLPTPEGSRIHGTQRDITGTMKSEREQIRLNRALRLLGDCNLTLVQTEDEQNLASEVCRHIVEIGGYRMAWIGVAEHDAMKRVRPVAQFACLDGYLETVQITWDETQENGRGPVGAAVRTGRTQIVQDVVENPRMLPWRETALRYGFQSCIALHLASEQQSLGSLNVYSAEPNAFETEEVALLEELANNLAFGLQTLRARRERAAALAASQAKSAFLTHMSHEIRTPMNAIVGMAHLMRSDGVTPRQAGQLEKIGVAAEHLMHIINDILDLSKIEAGKLTLEDTDIAIEALLGNIASILSQSTHEKGLQLVMQSDPLPRLLRGDLTRLMQALLNFANNSVKFTERGSIFIRTRLVDEEPDRVLLRFEVEDTGIGIDAQHLERLFLAFEQADTSTTREYGGTGLGLTITRRIAQLMGGDAGVSSTPGQGSTFWFTAWLRKCTDAGEQLEANSRPVSSEVILARDFAGTRVLLAEDDPVNREIAIAMLTNASFIVDVAENGERAVEMARGLCHDIILMDMQMPTLDGPGATRAIRSIAGCEDVPILAMTANVFVEDKARCLEAGMDDFLSKPVVPETLYDTLLYWLRDATSVD